MPNIAVYLNDEGYLAFSQLGEEIQKEIRADIVALIQKRVKKANQENGGQDGG